MKGIPSTVVTIGHYMVYIAEVEVYIFGHWFWFWFWFNTTNSSPQTGYTVVGVTRLADGK